jgi:hypothetical protein
VFSNVSRAQLSQIREILEQLDQGPIHYADDNRRHAHRLKIRGKMDAIILSAPGLPWVKIFSRNLSTSGIGFIARRPFNRGERVAISFELPAQAPKLVLSRTTFSRYVGGGVHEMGAEFVECITDTKGPDRIPEHWVYEAPSAKAVHAKG